MDGGFEISQGYEKHDGGNREKIPDGLGTVAPEVLVGLCDSWGRTLLFGNEVITRIGDCGFRDRLYVRF